MGCAIVSSILVVLIVIGIVVEANRSPEQKATIAWGSVNGAIVCPHCETRGRVRTKRVERKRGISGGKATGAILTGGLSLLATGLSRKEHPTQAHCDHCGSTWEF